MGNAHDAHVQKNDKVQFGGRLYVTEGIFRITQDIDD